VRRGLPLRFPTISRREVDPARRNQPTGKDQRNAEKEGQQQPGKVPTPPDAVPADLVLAAFNELAEEFWPDALRAAFTSNGALERCSRRSCRLAGSCQMIYAPNKPLDCGGGEPEAAVKEAAFAVVAGCAMIRAIAPDIARAVLPDIARAVLPDIALPDIAKDG
jgi:hypothetical protein